MSIHQVREQNHYTRFLSWVSVCMCLDSPRNKMVFLWVYMHRHRKSSLGNLPLSRHTCINIEQSMRASYMCLWVGVSYVCNTSLFYNYTTIFSLDLLSLELFSLELFVTNEGRDNMARRDLYSVCIYSRNIIIWKLLATYLTEPEGANKSSYLLYMYMSVKFHGWTFKEVINGNSATALRS